MWAQPANVPAFGSLAGASPILGKARLVRPLRERAQAAGVRIVMVGRDLDAWEQTAGIPLRLEGSDTQPPSSEYQVHAATCSDIKLLKVEEG
jgi:hypothetical protein